MKTTTLWVLKLSLCGIASLALADEYGDYSEIDLEKVHQRITILSGSTPAQWRITVKEDASTSATVSWSTLEPEGEHVLYYGRKSTGGDLEKYDDKQECQRSGLYTGALLKDRKEKKSGLASYHHAALSGLEPDTTYYLTMVSNGVASREFHFRTAPAKTEQLILIHGGDSRSGITARSKVNYMIGQMVEQNPKIWGFVHGGDYIVSGKSYSQWKAWLSQHELTTTSQNRIVPMVVAKGNHDGGPLYGEVFDFIADGDKQVYYYNTTFGDLASVITLDTNISGTGAQEEFLKASLEKLRSESKWLFTSYHRPLYPAVKNMPSQKKVFVPHFEKHNVDIALEADGHNIKRTVPIRDDKKDPTGVVYVGEGGLGVGQRTPKTDRWYTDTKEGAFIGKGHHVMLLTMERDKLEIKTIMLTGDVVDTHVQKVRK